MKSQRVIEIIIGLVTWLAITSPIWASFLIPKVMAYFIILMAVYWLYKSAKYAISAVFGFITIKRNEKMNWLSLAQKHPDFEKVSHIVIIPNYKELEEKIRINLKYLAAQTLSSSKIIVVLAMEEREGAAAKLKARHLIDEFGDTFGLITATFHPDLPGELKGKSSNEAWAGREIKMDLVDRKGVNINFLTITSCDVDSLFNPQYFAALTCLFLNDQNRYRKFWQGLLTEYANLDRTILPVRLVSAIDSVLRMALPFQEGFFLPYSTYSASLKMVDEVGFWDTDIIPEDWHMFFKCFFSLKGEVETMPIYLTNHGDSIEGSDFFDALKNRYVQNRRHAWGITDIPYIIMQWARHPEIPFFRRTLLVLRSYEAHFLWPTSWFLLFLGVNLPVVINPQLKETVLGYNFSIFARNILAVCLVMTFAFIILDLLSHPPQNKSDKIWVRIVSFLQWFLMPFITLFLATLPGLDAHTRIMLNRRIEYKVSEKKVGKGQ